MYLFNKRSFSFLFFFFFFFLVYIPSRRITVSYGSSLLSLWETSIVFSTLMHQFTFPPNISLSPPPHQHLSFVVFLLIDILTGVRWYFIMVLTCISLIIYYAEHLFVCTLATYHLWKNVFRFPDHCVVVVQPLSRIWLFATSWNAALQASLSFTVSQGLL